MPTEHTTTTDRPAASTPLATAGPRRRCGRQAPRRRRAGASPRHRPATGRRAAATQPALGRELVQRVRAGARVGDARGRGRPPTRARSTGGRSPWTMAIASRSWRPTPTSSLSSPVVRSTTRAHLEAARPRPRARRARRPTSSAGVEQQVDEASAASAASAAAATAASGTAATQVACRPTRQTDGGSREAGRAPGDDARRRRSATSRCSSASAAPIGPRRAPARARGAGVRRARTHPAVPSIRPRRRGTAAGAPASAPSARDEGAAAWLT